MIGHWPASISDALSQSVALKFPSLLSLEKNVRPGVQLVKLPPLLIAAASTAPVAAPAWPGTPLSAMSFLYCGLASWDQVVGQVLTTLRLQPKETYPP